VTQLQPLETIRNIFVLEPQTSSADIKHVLTRDRIPLKIQLAIKIQIEPASEVEKRPASFMPPHGEALTKKLDDGLYPVYEGTVRKAALLSQATSFAKREFTKCDDKQVCQDVGETTWQKAAGSLPEGELRDHIMSYSFSELFELSADTDGEPTPLIKRRTIYEIERAILEEIRTNRINVLGVLVRVVDIGKIEFPSKLTSAIVEKMISEERAGGQAEAIALVGRAKNDAVIGLLQRILEKLPYADEATYGQFISILQKIYQDALTDDVLIKDAMEANSEAVKKFAESEGPKILGAGAFVDPTHLLHPKGNGRS
jgi:hypothetical protein